MPPTPYIDPRDLSPETLKFDAPAPLRRQVRAQIDFLGLEAREHKGFYWSTFVVEGPSSRIAELSQWVRERA